MLIAMTGQSRCSVDHYVQRDLWPGFLLAFLDSGLANEELPAAASNYSYRCLQQPRSRMQLGRRPATTWSRKFLNLLSNRRSTPGGQLAAKQSRDMEMSGIKGRANGGLGLEMVALEPQTRLHHMLPRQPRVEVADGPPDVDWMPRSS